MKLFTDAEKRKRFMKTGLPYLLGIAWAPIIGVIVTAILGKPIATQLGWPLTLGITGMMTLLLIYLLLKFFRRTGQH